MLQLATVTGPDRYWNQPADNQQRPDPQPDARVVRRLESETEVVRELPIDTGGVTQRSLDRIRL